MDDVATHRGSDRQRVLLVGQATYDSVVDSYRRALEPHYDVTVFDPFAVLGSLGRRLGHVWEDRVARAPRCSVAHVVS